MRRIGLRCGSPHQPPPATKITPSLLLIYQYIRRFPEFGVTIGTVYVLQEKMGGDEGLTTVASGPCMELSKLPVGSVIRHTSPTR